MRVHLPNQFGDIINRTTLKNAESSGQTFTGAEMGPFGTFTLRAVSPWYEDGKLLGYVELGVSLDDMVNIFTQMFSVEPYLIVAKKFMVKERYEAIMHRFGVETNWDQLPNAVVIAGPDEPMPEDLIKIIKTRSLISDLSNLEISRKNSTYITGEINLRDAAHQNVGKLLLLVNTTDRIDTLNNAIRNMAGYAIFVNGLLFIVFFIILNNTERLFTAYHYKIVEEGQNRERLQKDHIKELEHLALYDPLTDLPNRQLLQDRIKHAIQAAQREKYPLALTILNLNRLREINNTLGHQAGDSVLQQLGSRLLQAIRASDTVARLGGDEFAVLMPKVDLTLSLLAVEKLQSLLEATFDVEGIPVSVSASFGIAFYPEDAEDVYHLIRHADVAMRESRRTHRGIVIYDSARDPYNMRKLKLFSDLKSAFVNDELFLEYQPKFDLGKNKVTAAEALVRWRHPVEGLIRPDEFVPLLENTALIKTLTENVLRDALYQISEWKKQNIDLIVSINVSMFDLFTFDIAEQIDDLLKHYGLKPSCLMLEITESVIMEDPEATINLLTRLHDMKIELSIDDYGTGYSSLAYLQRLPVSELKIDKSFISKMADNASDEVIVSSTIQLAHSLGLTVVAEGVDDLVTWKGLEMLKCDVIQGYFISPSMPADKLGSWLSESTWKEKLKQSV
jgi:diguanylate cyclase (GGDEF)-like protein